MLKFLPMEKQYKNLTEMNILMKTIAEESKNPIVIFDQMLPIYGNLRFKEEFGLNDDTEIKEIKKADKAD